MDTASLEHFRNSICVVEAPDGFAVLAEGFTVSDFEPHEKEDAYSLIGSGFATRAEAERCIAELTVAELERICCSDLAADEVAADALHHEDDRDNPPERPVDPRPGDDRAGFSLGVGARRPAARSGAPVESAATKIPLGDAP